jgi:hypothetical protein
MRLVGTENREPGDPPSVIIRDENREDGRAIRSLNEAAF